MVNFKENQDDQITQEPELSIHDCWLIINRGKFWVIISIIIMLMLTIYYNYSVSPEYSATTTILIENGSNAAAIFDFGGGINQSEISNQIEILKSRQVAVKAVKNLWNSNHRNRLEIFGTRKFLPRGQRPRRFIRKIITLGFYNPDSNKPDKFDEEFSENIGHRFSGRIQNSISVSNKRGTDILLLSATSPFPEEAALLANTVAQEFVRLDREWAAEETHNLLSFLKDQLQLKDGELASAEEKVKIYMEKEKIFDLSGNANRMLKQSTEIESKYFEIVAEKNISKEKIRYIKKKLSHEEMKLADQLRNSINTKVFALRQEISAREMELISHEGLYGTQHDAVKSSRAQLVSLKDQLDVETKALIARGLSVADPIEYRNELINELIIVEAALASFQSKSDEYGKLIENYNAQISELPKKQMEFARLERDRTVLNETYMFMRQKLEEARVNVASERGKVQIIDNALKPGSASKPDKSRNMLLGFVLGISLGIGGVFLREFLDRTIQSVDWVERFGISVLGIIPVVQEVENREKNTVRKKTKSSSGTHSVYRHLITRENPKSPISESYRTLRTNVLYCQADKDIKSILVSSPSPGEGKTTTVSNLAITFANMGKRTLLVDADLRRPVLHGIFDLKRDPGLTHYLAGKIQDFDALIQKTDIDNLHAVTAGIMPPNPSELLGSNKMSELISRLENEWDIVLLDSPPIVAVTDATMVSQKIDAMIMVVKAGETDREAFRRAVKSLQGINVPLVGVVVNGISRRTSKDSYYYYYQYYQQYYGGSYGHDSKDEEEIIDKNIA